MYNNYDSGPMGGPMVQGRWMNKRTGAVIFVRDSVIDGDNMIIITDKGQLDMNTFSRDYIQASDDVYNESGQVIGKQTLNTDEIVQSQPMMPPTPTQRPQSTAVVETPSVGIKQYEMIDKIFKKNESKPVIKFEIDWADFPATELKMLVDYFDVTLDDISKYINKNLVNQQAIVESLNEFVAEKM